MCVCAQSHSPVQLFATPWAVAHQTPLSMGIPRQEDWSGLPFPTPRDLPDLGNKLESPALQIDSLLSEPPEKPKDTGVGSPIPSPGDLPNPGLELGSLTL